MNFLTRKSLMFFVLIFIMSNSAISQIVMMPPSEDEDGFYTSAGHYFDMNTPKAQALKPLLSGVDEFSTDSNVMSEIRGRGALRLTLQQVRDLSVDRFMNAVDSILETVEDPVEDYEKNGCLSRKRVCAGIVLYSVVLEMKNGSSISESVNLAIDRFVLAGVDIDFIKTVGNECIVDEVLKEHLNCFRSVVPNIVAAQNIGVEVKSKTDSIIVILD